MKKLSTLLMVIASLTLGAQAFAAPMAKTEKTAPAKEEKKEAGKNTVKAPEAPTPTKGTDTKDGNAKASASDSKH